MAPAVPLELQFWRGVSVDAASREHSDHRPCTCRGGVHRPGRIRGRIGKQCVQGWTDGGGSLDGQLPYRRGRRMEKLRRGPVPRRQRERGVLQARVFVLPILITRYCIIKLKSEDPRIFRGSSAFYYNSEKNGLQVGEELRQEVWRSLRGDLSRCPDNE